MDGWISLKELFTRFTTLFTGAVAAFAFYWINLMDEGTKKLIMDTVGPYGPWITPVAAYVVWLGLRAKKQKDEK